MATLTKELIAQAAAPRTVELEIPEWGGTVRLRELSIAEVAGLAGSDTEKKQTAARLVAASVVGDDGAPLFTIEDIEGMAANRGRPAINRLVARIDELNGLTAKAQADIEKN